MEWLEKKKWVQIPVQPLNSEAKPASHSFSGSPISNRAVVTIQWKERRIRYVNMNSWERGGKEMEVMDERTPNSFEVLLRPT